VAKWTFKRRVKNIDEICKVLGLNKPLAYAVAVRDIKPGKELESFINSSITDFDDINKMIDVVKAYDIIVEAINDKLPICIYGDYDADGVLSTTILCKALSALGGNVTYYIPHRIEDGYGLSNSSVINISEVGIKLIITCDNGIAASEQIELANKLGMRVVVLDHHEPAFIEENGVKRDIIPSAEAVVDAKIKSSEYSFREMCAGGLCYRFVKGLFGYMGEDFSLLDNELITFAGIATICDVVDLVSENRILAKKAIENINTNIENTGLKALVDIKNLDTINSYHIGFIIGPCINASGRLDSASIAVELFLTDDETEAMKKAEILSDINEERKDMTNKGIENVVESIGSNPEDKIIVVYNEEIHESIAGIIAGRIKEIYNRPAIVLTKSKDNNMLKGSARSIEKYNMFEGLYAQRVLIEKFGGHAMAAGLSIVPKNLNKLRTALNENCELTESDLVENIKIEGALNLEDITEQAIDELDILQPCGKGNPSPVYGTIGVRVVSFNLIGKDKQFVRVVLRDNKGYEVRAVDFNNYDKWEKLIKSEGYTMETASLAKPLIDVVYQLDINEFNGYRNPQIRIKDLRKNLKK
jgi:single-stranded-DNA-specific exonuclease recJ